MTLAYLKGKDAESANAENAPVQLPVLDSDGYPIQNRGVTDYDGLFFLGMPWLHSHLRRLFSDLSRVDDEFERVGILLRALQ